MGDNEIELNSLLEGTDDEMTDGYDGHRQHGFHKRMTDLMDSDISTSMH